MSALEIALIILVSIWSIIFIIIAIAVIMLVVAIRKGISKANTFLDKTGAVADKVDLPSKLVIATIVGFVAKNSFGTVKKIISGFLSKNK